MPRSLTGGRLLKTNVLLSTAAQGGPLVLGLIAMPLLARALGTERFGVLLILWAIFGYFSLFEFGIARAMIKLYSEGLSLGRSELGIRALFWTAVISLWALGSVAGGVCALAAPAVATGMFRVGPALSPEVLAAFYAMAVAVPVLSVTTGVRGVLEVYQRYDFVAVVRVLTGVGTFVVPLAVVPFSTNIGTIALLLVAARIGLLGLTGALALRVAPHLWKPAFAAESLKALIALGGWMSVSTGVGLALVYIDRFVIGGILGMTAVAYFATPYDLVTRLWILPVAVTGVLYPALAATLRTDRSRAHRLFQRSTSLVIIFLLPATILMVSFAQEILGIWMGAEFAHHSTRVMQWLTVGVLAHGLFRVGTGLAHADGRPRFVAVLQVLEIPLYLAILPPVLRTYGIVGGAAAWTVRAIVEASALLLYVERWVLPGALRREYAALGLGGILIAATFVPDDSAFRMGVGLVGSLIFAWYAWHVLLTGGDRTWLRRRLRLLPNA